MTIKDFFDRYTDPSNNDYILCDKQILINFIEYSKTSKTSNKNIQKKPPNIFIMWKNDNIDLLKLYFDDYNDITNWSKQSKIDYYKNKDIGIPKKDGKPKLVELITIKAGIIWKSIDQDVKNKYELKRDNAIKEFNSSSTNPIVKMNDFWLGPYYNKEISKKVKKDGKNIPVYKDHTLNQIISIAENMGNLCGGITKTSTGKYSLRFGELVDKPNVCSWLKKDYVYKPNKSKRGRPKNPKQYDSDSEDEELSNQNDMLVVKIEYNGIVYFLNESTNDIYDPISGDIVGVYDTGIINLY